MSLYGLTSLQREKKIRALFENLQLELFLGPLLKRVPTHCMYFSYTYLQNVALIFKSDVLRRRFQINTMTGMGYEYKSIPDAVRIIISQEGIRGMYKGIVPNLLKVAPSMATSWLSFEITRDLLTS